VWQPFKADKCTTLAGKPKLFICQACKGEKKNPGSELEKLRADGSIERIATQSDFIWGFSTFPGEVSYRNSKKGSIYIQALCKVILRDSKRTMDFASILTEANCETNRVFNKKGYDEFMQCSYFSTTLRGTVNFPKKNRILTNARAIASSVPLPPDESDEEMCDAFDKINLASSQAPSTIGIGHTEL
jgi:hypothetical protein